MQNHLEVVKVLISRANADIDRSEELNASYSLALLISSKEIIETLLSAGADVNYFENPAIPSIFAAISRKNLDIVKTLQEHGADLNRIVGDGSNALMFAISEENVEAVEYFISLGKHKSVIWHYFNSPYYFCLIP